MLSSPKRTVPKSDKGSIPVVLVGASATHSADFRSADGTLAVLLKDCPVVSSVIVTVNFRSLKLTCADMRSPGCIWMVLMLNDGCGKNSYQA